MHVGGVARGVSGHERVSRLAVEPGFYGVMANGIKRWEIIVFPCADFCVIAVEDGEAACFLSRRAGSQHCMTP